MIQRKTYLIDKKFQLKKSIIVISSVFIIIAVIIISAGTVIAINNRQLKINDIRIMNNIKGIEQNIDIQQEALILDLLNPEKKFNNKKKSDVIIKNYNNSMDTKNASIKSNESMIMIEANKNIVRKNSELFITIIAVSLTGLAFLFFLIIRQTQKISGPVYLMTMYAKEILNGGSPDMRDLREKDDFKDFYVLFKQMAGRIIELENKSSGK